MEKTPQTKAFMKVDKGNVAIQFPDGEVLITPGLAIKIAAQLPSLAKTALKDKLFEVPLKVTDWTEGTIQ